MIYTSTFILIYSLVLALIIGAVSGSFLNCVAWRIAHKESFLKGRSHCPQCGHTLSLLDLVPIFSWLFLGGKCRYCKSKISPRYIIIELIMAAAAILCLLKYDISLLCLRNFLLFGILMCLLLVDLDIYEIPNGCVLAGIIVWAAYIPFVGNDSLDSFNSGIFQFESAPLTYVVNGLLGGVVIGGFVLIVSIIMDKLLKKESMGGGDIKLMFVCGLYLGLIAGIVMLIIACIVGIVASVIKRSHDDTEDSDDDGITTGAIPFGPAIAFATWAVLMFGGPLLQWYAQLLGL